MKTEPARDTRMQTVAWGLVVVLGGGGALAQPVAQDDSGGWSEWKSDWTRKAASVREGLAEKTSRVPGAVNEYWTDHADSWRSGWGELQTDARGVWRDQVDPRETYTEEVLEAVRDPETARRVLTVALTGSGKEVLAEKLRWVPVYDPYTGQLRTLDGAARELVGREGAQVAGSAFEADPVGATSLTLMLDRSTLWGARILRRRDGGWTSVRELLGGSAEERVRASELGALHDAVLAAHGRGDGEETAVLLGRFADTVEALNRSSLAPAGGGVGSVLAGGPATFDALATATRSAPASLVSRLESDPVALLRGAADLSRVGKHYLARRDLQELVDRFPHSGFVDDAMFDLAKGDFDNANVDSCIERLNLLLERHPTSARCDDALYLLGNCFESRVAPTDVQRREAVRNYKEILRKYEDGSRDWKAEVMELVVSKAQAVDCYRLLVDSFADSPYLARATRKLAELEGK